eukprot:scaffold5887_cov122-Cylindrotheca_fusiformis.AAC.13
MLPDTGEPLEFDVASCSGEYWGGPNITETIPFATICLVSCMPRIVTFQLRQPTRSCLALLCPLAIQSRKLCHLQANLCIPIALHMLELYWELFKMLVPMIKL